MHVAQATRRAVSLSSSGSAAVVAHRRCALQPQRLRVAAGLRVRQRTRRDCPDVTAAGAGIGGMCERCGPRLAYGENFWLMAGVMDASPGMKVCWWDVAHL